MRETIKRLGISEKTLNQMEEMCPNIKELTTEEVEQKIQILKELKCDEIQIRNIISSNAMYLDRINTDIHRLIEKMEEIGFDNLNILLDGNPYILNLDAFEIENYIESRKENGETIEDIVDEMSSNPYIFEEI